MSAPTKPEPSGGAGCLAWFVILWVAWDLTILGSHVEKLEARVEKLESKDSPKEAP